MATITQKITIDVARANVFSAIIGKQFDTDSRFLQCTLAQEGVAMEIESGVTVSINARRPDNTTSSFAGERNADGTVTVPIDEWILEQNGMVSLSVSIVSASGEKLTSCTFYLNVQQAEGEGWLWVFTATDVVATGTYHINFGGTDYEFTLPTALESGDKIYFSSALDYAKSVEPTGAEIDTMILTVGSGGTALVSSELINFLASLESELASYNSRVEGVEEALTDKADKSGEFEDLTAGTANAVIDKDSYSLSTSPYLHRISPSGKRCEYDVIGGTVGWNQLVPSIDAFFAQRATASYSGNIATLTVNNDGITAGRMTLARSTSIKAPIANHKYVIHAEVMSATHLTSVSVRYGNSINSTFSNITDGQWNTLQFMRSNSEPTGNYFQIDVYGAFASGATCQIRNFYTIDLTTLLGSTIADYAYQLEQTTAGSGIAWLKSFGFLTKSYYPFCEPTLESVQATERKAVGINQWDEEWEKCIWNEGQNGVKQPSELSFGCKDYISALPSTTYCLSRGVLSNFYVLYYDADHACLGYNRTNTNTQNTFTTPDGCHYITFYSYNSYGTTYKNDICINISNPTINGQYFPYESHTYLLGDVTLRGIPKLDSSNNIYYDGDVYKASGEITRKYGVVDLGTLTWNKVSMDGNAYYSNVISDAMAVGNVTTANVLCAKYDLYMSGNGGVLLDKTYRFGGTYTGTKRVTIRDDAYTTATAFRTAMSGVYLVYELATPTTEATDSFTPIQYTGSTEAFTTSNDVPVGVEGKYYNDKEAEQNGQIEGVMKLLLNLTKNVALDKIGVVDLGSLNWGSGSGGTQFYTAIADAKNVNGVNAICALYTNHGFLNNGWSSLGIDEYAIYNQTLRIYPSASYASADAFKQALSGVLLAYEKA